MSPSPPSSSAKIMYDVPFATPMSPLQPPMSPLQPENISHCARFLTYQRRHCPASGIRHSAHSGGRHRAGRRPRRGRMNGKGESTMTSIMLHSTSRPDGKLHLEVPVGVPNTEFEVEVV